jgi:quinolinate synthase
MRAENMETVVDKASVDAMYEQLSRKLRDVVPDIELRYKAEIACQVNALKAERDAVILGHNYMEPALYNSITDIRGDSLELSRAVMNVDKGIIVFCGVRFMAETAKILNPHKTVLFPGKRGGCSLADGITAEDVRKLKEMFPGVPVVSYVNTRADVKAESDICCTSGNATRVVQSLHTDTVIFIPDEYLARNVAKESGKHIIFPHLGADQKTDTTLDYQMIGWHARCEVHDKFTPEDVRAVRKQFPDVAVLAHPECRPEVIEEVDFCGSTAAMIKYVETTAAPRYLLLTECSMGDNVAAANPDKEMLRLCSVRCPHMNEITLEDTLRSLQNLQQVIEIPEPIRVRAYAAVGRMLHIS